MTKGTRAGRVMATALALWIDMMYNDETALRVLWALYEGIGITVARRMKRREEGQG